MGLTALRVFPTMTLGNRGEDAEPSNSAYRSILTRRNPQPHLGGPRPRHRIGTGEGFGCRVHGFKAALSIAVGTLACCLVLVTGAGASGASPAPSAVPAVQSAGIPTYQWPEAHGNPRLTGLSGDTVHQYSQRRSARCALDGQHGVPVTQLARWSAYNQALGQTVVYAGTEGGWLTAYSETSGQTIWSVNIGTAIRSTPVVDGSSIWVVGHLQPAAHQTRRRHRRPAVRHHPALRPGRGEPGGGHPSRRSADHLHGVGRPGSERSGLRLPYGRLLRRMAERALSAWGAASGTSCPTPSTPRPRPSPAVNPWSCSARRTPTVRCTPSTPRPVPWCGASRPQAVNNDSDVGAGVAVSAPGVNGFADGVAYTNGKDGITYAVDLTTGAPIWNYVFEPHEVANGSRSTPALAGNQLVFGTSEGTFDLNATTGALIWHYVLPAGDENLGAVAIEGPLGQRVVLTTNLYGQFQVLSLATGALLYSYQTGSYIGSVAGRGRPERSVHLGRRVPLRLRPRGGLERIADDGGDVTDRQLDHRQSRPADHLGDGQRPGRCEPGPGPGARGRPERHLVECRQRHLGGRSVQQPGHRGQSGGDVHDLVPHRYPCRPGAPSSRCGPRPSMPTGSPTSDRTAVRRRHRTRRSPSCPAPPPPTLQTSAARVAPGAESDGHRRGLPTR